MRQGIIKVEENEEWIKQEEEETSIRQEERVENKMEKFKHEINMWK